MTPPLQQKTPFKLFYKSAGEGHPLILLHGNGEDCTYFDGQISFFAKYRRVIAIDTRGHGASPRGVAPFSLNTFADDLYDFIKSHGIETADILGFSDGGNVALLFALTHPEMVTRLILNGANLSPKGIKASVQLPIELGYRLARAFAKKSDRAKANAEMLGLMVNEPHISKESLERLKMPVMVIAGTNDMVKRKHTRLIQSSIKNSRLVLIKGDHFIANRRPEEFNRAVLDFLETT